MLKIRTFILALSLTPLLALNWQTSSSAQTSPSVGTAGSMSGGGNTGTMNTSPSVGTAGSTSGGGSNSTSGNTVSNPNPSVGNAGGQSGAGNGTANNGNPDDNTSPSVGNAGGQSGAGNETGNNANNGGDTDTGNNNEGNNDNPSGPVENLTPRASSISIVRTRRGNIIRIKIAAQKQINEVAVSLLNRNNPGVLVALLQGGSIGQTASDNLTNLLSNAGVNTDLGNNLRVILSRIVPNQGNADVDINQLNNAINTYNQIIQQSSPVTLQALSQSQDFVAIGKALKELRAAVN
ncbi:MAG: hypothetical protein HEQ33_05695 [Dolichospermum sp. WA123]|nr:hypothetical protein [Dolichospermum sp. WA123]